MSELAVIDETTRPTLDVGYWGEVLVFASRMADAVGDTEFVPGSLRGRREAVAATILYGVEVGVTPMQALAGIHIVDGRPSPSAELMRALILRAGHTLHVVEMTGTRARVWGQRKGRPESERVVVEWTTDMARSAGLLGRQNWQRYPRAMLVARATGDLARVLFPDVIKGLGYVAEDDPGSLDAWAPSGAGPEVETPARKPLQRRRRPARGTPVDEVAAPALEPVEADPAPVAPLIDSAYPAAGHAPAEPHNAQGYPREPAPLLTDEEMAARDEARKPSDPAPHVGVGRVLVEEPPISEHPSTDDVPLPEDMQPTGTGRPAPSTSEPVLPDVEPEAPDVEGPPGAVMLGVRPMKALQAGLTRELGTVATREERHALVAAILGHEVESTKTLTRADGYRVLAMFDAFDAGDAKWEFVDGGEGIRVWDTREPPEDQP